MKSTCPTAAPRPRSGWTDPQGRQLRYLRLAVTDRCNLRCRYCMPASGVAPNSSGFQLSFDELTRVCRVLVRGGITKIRVTGGEPLARRGLADWMQEVAGLDPAAEILLTTNGVLLADALPQLVAAGLRRVNLSLDTLDPITWRTITRRGGFAAVRDAIDAVLAAELGLKINVVIQPGVNDHEIADFVALTREREIRVRFIEPMPFTGSDTTDLPLVSGEWILQRVRERFGIEELPRSPGNVERRFRIDGHRGTVGVIEGNSRSFCGDCSRLRLNSRGELRTCLYGAPAADLGAALRAGADDAELVALIDAAIARRLPDGHAAEAARHGTISMAEVGG